MTVSLIASCILTALLVPGTVSGGEVCYPVLGCFNNRPPFNNAGNELPQSPGEIGTKLLLFTQENPDTPEALSYSQPVSITQSYFSGDEKTYVLIHGLNNDEHSPWLKDITDALLEREDCNVIVVAWGPGARITDYAQASANVRIVATQVKVLIKLMVRLTDLDLDQVHIIGHSLGAHIAGYVGTLLGNKVRRITGLDPADPNFEDLPALVRLDSTDAQFVDVIHTNGLEYDTTVGFGVMRRSGHIDFYVNGGEEQKGCIDGLAGGLSGALRFSTGGASGSLAQTAGRGISCSHSRAHQIFLESITSSCKFRSYPCPTHADFLKGKCFDCEPGGCSEAGYFADRYATAGGKHYITTFGKPPFCGAQYYRIIIRKSIHQKETKGEITVTLRSKNGKKTRSAALFGRDTKVIGTKDINRVIVLDQSVDDLGGIDSIEIRYARREGVLSWFSQATMDYKLRAIEITEVVSGRTFETYGQIPKYLKDRKNKIISLQEKL